MSCARKDLDQALVLGGTVFSPLSLKRAEPKAPAGVVFRPRIVARGSARHVDQVRVGVTDAPPGTPRTRFGYRSAVSMTPQAEASTTAEGTAGLGIQGVSAGCSFYGAEDTATGSGFVPGPPGFDRRGRWPLLLWDAHRLVSVRRVRQGHPVTATGATFWYPQVWTGDLLRAAAQRGTDHALRARAAMDAGQLVADEIVLRIIGDRLAEPGTRKASISTASRATNCAGRGPLAACGRRWASRWTPWCCSRSTTPSWCDASTYAPAAAAPAAACSRSPQFAAWHAAALRSLRRQAELVQRPDDNGGHGGVRRLEVYDAQTRPLIDHYRRRGAAHARGRVSWMR